MTATAMAGVIGAPISSALLQLDGAFGLRGWQWLFLVEGLPAILLAPVVLTRLTERPQDATWLEPAEREWLSNEIATRAGANRGRAPHVRGRRSQREAVGDLGGLLLHRGRVLRHQLLAAADHADRPAVSARPRSCCCRRFPIWRQPLDW